jgi:hypothetical protein
MVAYWRIRLKNEQGEFTRQAWDRDQVGIWYGAWSVDDLKNAAVQGGRRRCWSMTEG